MANEQRLIDANKIKYKEYRSGGGRDYPENIVTEYEIAKMPTVDAVEVVHGRWIKADGPIVLTMECSVCHMSFLLGSYNYCPNCGAKMDGWNENA